MPECPGHFDEKTITTAGTCRFGKRPEYVANALTNERIGMEAADEGL